MGLYKKCNDHVPMGVLMIALSAIVATFAIAGYQKHVYRYTNVDSERVRECMEIALEYERVGEHELQSFITGTIRTHHMIGLEYDYFMERKVDISRRYYEQCWKNDTFKFMEKHGVDVKLPQGYIQKETK